jgi:hypothetical protein
MFDKKASLGGNFKLGSLDLGLTYYPKQCAAYCQYFRFGFINQAKGSKTCIHTKALT